MTEMIDLLDLQARLRSDNDGRELRGLEQQLADWRRPLKQHVDAGVTKEKFGMLSAIIDAMDAAAEVLDVTWRHYHKSRT
jgi:hypothetical protein